MRFKRSAAALAITCWLMIFVSPPASRCAAAEALLVYDIKTNDSFTGEKEAVMKTAFTPRAMYVDIQTRFIGSWMKRIFGKVTESRETTHFLLDEGQIHEVNYSRGNVRVTPLDQIADVAWVSEKSARPAGVEEMIKERYTVEPGQFQITPTDIRAVINGFEAQRIDATLRLETYDKKKNASSVTLVKQELWVTRTLPQYGVYQAFFEALASQMGLEAERLKGLGSILQYWEGSLDPIRDQLDASKGLPVKSVTSVEAVYTKNVGTPKSETIRKQIKSETLLLKSVQDVAADADFEYSEAFQLVYAK
jgi:hypothetical protein